MQVFKKIEEPIDVTKVIFTKEMDANEEKYFEYISKGLKIRWGKIVLYFPFDFSDQNAIFINQRSGRIQAKGLSQQYTDGIAFIAEDISGENQGKVRKALRMIM